MPPSLFLLASLYTTFPSAAAAHPCLCLPVLLAKAHFCKVVLASLYGILSRPSMRLPGVTLGKTTLNVMQVCA